MQTVDPLEARQWFKWREPMAWVFSGALFALLFFLLQPPLGGLFAFAIALLVSGCLFFFYLDKRTFGIVCPHSGCKKYIETTTPWICGVCGKNNLRTDEFPFIGRCEHNECRAEPKAYQCHHCKRLIFFTKDEQRFNFAKCINIPAEEPRPRPVKKDQDVEQIVKLDKGIQLTERMVKKAELDVKLKEFKEVLEPAKPRTQKEAIEESFANFADRNMTGAEIVRRKKAENAEKYKDNPPELERQNLLVDQWARDHLDMM